MKLKITLKQSLLALSLTFFPHLSIANIFDPLPVWPLCGQVTKVPSSVSGWKEGDNCPKSRIGTNYSDFPLSSTFGPRQLKSGNYRYDFHRGIDIPAAIGTPVFAITDGIVKKAGVDKNYKEPLVIIRHFKQGYTGTSCKSSGGCYHSVYLHMRNAIVDKGQKVSKGDLIGYTGVSASGFEHLHFEIRHAPSDDPYSYWQRDSIHPLKILPFDHNISNSISLKITDINEIGDTLEVGVDVRISMQSLDLLRLEVKVYNKQTNIPVVQKGNATNIYGYNIEPSFFDLEQWNREYTHKNSSKVSWESYAEGGGRDCPYSVEHTDTYDAHVHMDKASPENFQVGSFNGLNIAPKHYNANSSEYFTHYEFTKLTGTHGAENCIVIEATDSLGNVTKVINNCNETLN